MSSAPSSALQRGRVKYLFLGWIVAPCSAVALSMARLILISTMKNIFVKKVIFSQKRGPVYVRVISGLKWGVCHGGRHDKYNIYYNYVSTTIGKLLPPMHWLVHVNVIEVVVYI